MFEADSIIDYMELSVYLHRGTSGNIQRASSPYVLVLREGSKLLNYSRRIKEKPKGFPFKKL